MYQLIRVTRIANVGMIKDIANSILVHQVHPPSTSGTTHFEGYFISAKPIERPRKSIYVKMGNQRDKPMNTIGDEGPRAHLHQP